MGLGYRFAFLALLFFSLAAHSADECKDQIRQIIPMIGGVAVPDHPFAYRPGKDPMVIAEAIPEFDPETELLFHLYGGHSSFFTGGWRVDYGPWKIRKHSIVMRQGLVFRLKIGAERVRVLTAAFEKQEFTNLNALTCHHTDLAVLQRYGIHLKGGPRFLGSDNLKAMLQEGFVDDNGISFPQDQFLVGAVGPDHFERTLAQLKRFELGWVHKSYTMFGLKPADLAADLKAHFPGTDFVPILTLLGTDEGRKGLSDGQQALIEHVSQNLGAIVMEELEKRFKMSPAAALEYFATHRHNVPKPELRALVSDSLAKAIRAALAAGHKFQPRP